MKNRKQNVTRGKELKIWMLRSFRNKWLLMFLRSFVLRILSLWTRMVRFYDDAVY